MSYDRLTADNAGVLLVDHQTRLSNDMQDQSVPEYITSVTAVVKLAKLFKLLTVVTTSGSDGPNGPVLPIITETLADAPVIHRPGEISAWENNEVKSMNNPMKSNACAKLLFALATLIIVVSSPKSVRAQDGEHVGRLHAELISFNQVPAVLAQSSGRFEAEITEDKTISFSLYYENMSSSVTQAHIHFGASKTNGGVMVFLCGSPKPACPPSGKVTGTLTAADVSMLPATNADSVIPQGISPGDLAGMLSAILSGNSYVNVHTTKFPAGEIRGEVHVR